MNGTEKVYIVTGYNTLIGRRIILSVFIDELTAEKYVDEVSEKDINNQWKTLEVEHWRVN